MNRRFTVLTILAVLAAGFAGWRPLSTKAAPHRQSQEKGATQPLQDKRLIRANAETQGLQQQVETARKTAFEHGYFACCVQPPCSWCLLNMGKCTCAMGVGSGHYACRECHGGWEAGQGRIPGKSKQDVRKMKTLATKDANLQPAPPAPEASGAKPGPPTAPEASGAKSGTPAAKPGASEVDAQTIAAGEKMFQSNKCQTCHQLNGQGGQTGPDLTHEAQRHADLAWQIAHLKNPAQVHPGSTMPSYASLSPDQLKALAAFLITRK